MFHMNSPSIFKVTGLNKALGGISPLRAFFLKVDFMNLKIMQINKAKSLHAVSNTVSVVLLNGNFEKVQNGEAIFVEL